MLKSKKNYLFYTFFIFAFSIIVCYVFLFVERKILNIDAHYHPDSAYYLKNYRLFSYLSFSDSFVNNSKNFIKNIFSGTLFFSIINLFHELKEIINFSNPYRNFLRFNILIYSITNSMIIFYYFKNFNKITFKTFIFLIIFFLLPYKIHLAVNVLKENLIYFFLVLTLITPNIFIYLLSFVFGTSLRSLYVLYLINIIDFKSLISKKNFLIFISIIIVFLFVITNLFDTKNFFTNLMNYFYSRNLSDMGGRDYDLIPNFQKNEYGIILRIIFWPLLMLTGLFTIFNQDFYFLILGLEIIILQIILYNTNKKIIFDFNIILFLSLLAIYTTSFTSFFRYGYLAIQISFLKKFFLNSKNSMGKNF
jgi:hypothetical protein